MGEVREFVIAGNYRQIKAAVRRALKSGAEPRQILQTMVEALETVGDKFQSGGIFVPEMLLAAKTVKDGVEALKPYLPQKRSSCKGKVIIGTVAGDIHDIGKNLVMMIMESFGIEVIDLGLDAPTVKFLDYCEADPDVRIIACSTLLTTALPALKETVEAINAAPWRSRVKVMVGGGPVTQEFADQIGADIYTRDAASAGRTARDILEASE